MKCPKCGKAWPVDTVRWTISEECPCCKGRKGDEERQRLARYKELYLLLTVKGEVEFDAVCEWCVGQMEDVYSDRSVVPGKYSAKSLPDISVIFSTYKQLTMFTPWPCRRGGGALPPCMGRLLSWDSGNIMGRRLAWWLLCLSGNVLYIVHLGSCVQSKYFKIFSSFGLG